MCDFRKESYEHVKKAEKDEFRFQRDRIYASLIKLIKAEANGRKEWVALFACYQFVSAQSQAFHYDAARRLHGEEMAARRLPSPRLFCSSLARGFKQDPEPLLKQLVFRVHSIASWMEAEESFLLWLVFKDLRQMWRGNLNERAQTIQAFYLSQIPQRLLTQTKHRGRVRIGAHLRPELGVGTNYDNRPWTDRQWKLVLEQAARLMEKRYDCTELERWVWWCYPIFRRYKWSAREILDAASERKIDFEKEKAGIDKQETFQKYWIRRGLRFRGRKQKQSHTPPLAAFVRHIVVPDAGKIWGSFGGFLSLPKKN